MTLFLGIAIGLMIAWPIFRLMQIMEDAFLRWFCRKMKY